MEEAKREYERRAAEFGLDRKWARMKALPDGPEKHALAQEIVEWLFRWTATVNRSQMGEDDASREPERRATVGGVPEADVRLGAARSAQMARSAESTPRLRHMPVVCRTVSHIAGLGGVRQP
jgi:hypothetical protein